MYLRLHTYMYTIMQKHNDIRIFINAIQKIAKRMHYSLHINIRYVSM
jgi:hypothetical protein